VVKYACGAWLSGTCGTGCTALSSERPLLRCPRTHLPVEWVPWQRARQERGLLEWAPRASRHPPRSAVGPHDLACARGSSCAVTCIVRRSAPDGPEPAGFRCPLTGRPVERWARAIEVLEEVCAE